MSIPKIFEKAMVLFLMLFLLLFVACNPLADKQKVDEDFAPGIDQTIELTGLTYGATSFSLTKNAAITNLTPTLATGVALSYSISPDLPTGLSIDSVTGVISGTPTSIQAASDYVVTALGEKELTASTTISISVVSTSSIQSSVGVDTASVAADGATAVTVTVTLFDVDANPIVGNVVSLASNRGGADTISAISATTNSSGVATFFVTSTTAGSATLTATDATESLVITQTQTVSFNSGAATKVAFSTEPSTTGTAGVNLTTQPVVQIQDAFNNVTTSTDSVTLSLYSDNTCTTAVTTTPNASSSTSGTLTVAATSGASTFAGIKINKAASTLYLKAESGALTTDCSTAMNISPAIFDLDESTLGVSASTVTSGSSITTTLTAKDEFGNSNPSGVTTVTFDSTVIGGTGSFGSTTNAGNGVFTASFTGTLVGSVTLSGEINGDSITETEAVTVNYGAPASIAATAGTGQSAAHHTQLTTAFSVTVKDANNNVIPDETIDWDVTAGGGSLSSSQNDTNASGVSSSTLTLGAIGTNTARARVNSNLAITVSINATATTTAFTDNWDFASNTDYTPSSGDWLTSNLEITGGVCRLEASDQVDSDDTSSGFAGGTFSGVTSYGVLTGESASSGLKLGNNGGCDGSTRNCFDELDSSWTPYWNDILFYYKMNNNWSPSKGSVTGTATGATFSSSSKLGSHAGNFNGSNYVDLGNLAVTPTAYTIMFWAKRNTVSTAYSVLFGWNTYLGIWMYEGGAIGFGDANGTWGQWTAGWTDKTEYHHIAIVVPTAGTSSVATLYFDGINKGNITVNTSGAWSAVNIGKFGGGGGFAPQAYIDDFAVWTRELTLTDITQIYTRQSTKYSGTFTSRIMDAFVTGQSWTSLTWNPTLPFNKALPDYTSGAIQNETTGNYSSLYSSTLMNGIVGLWHLDEVSWADVAGEVIDNSGQGNHGQGRNGLQSVTNGKFGRAARFDGTNDYIQINSNLALSNLTISMWINPDSISALRALLVSGGGSDAAVLNAYINTSGQPYFFTTNSDTTRTSITSTISLIPGLWSHVVLKMDGTGRYMYINGILAASDTKVVNVVRPSDIGYKGGYYFMGLMDEVAIWNRALDPAEIKQLYQRGASRLKFQVRSCDDNACSGETWKGPDGTAATFFSELYNMSTQAATPSGTVNASLPSMTLANYTSAPSSNRYFQYRTIFESDSGTAALQPELKSVTVAPTHYDNTSPFVISNNGISFYSLSDFTHTLSGACAGGIGYNIGLSNTGPWKYWNGSAWVTSNGTVAQSNTATVIDTNAATFGSTVGTGSVFFKAYLSSDGATPCGLGDIQVDGQR